MRIALISDIHGNLIALEAALRDIRRHAPDMILSLGDQVNLGPCPREVLSLLRSEDVVCLRGNHERYILSVMDGDPAYDGANFNSLRFQAKLLQREDLELPKVKQIDGVTFCHAMPDDDRFPVFDVAQALPLLKQMTFDKPTQIFCGHGHNPKHYKVGNLTLECIGSLGCMDDSVPGVGPYVILDIDGSATAFQPYYVAYDTARVPDMFRQSGMAEFCPIMAHISCLQMMRNRDYLMQFVPLAREISGRKGEACVSEASWREADAQFAWPDGVRTREFWATV